jgi:transposase
MLTWEEDVEVHALIGRGWTISAIARHLGRSRNTIRAYVRGERQPGHRLRSRPDAFEPFVPYLRQRLADDPHVWASALLDEVCRLGYEGCYSTFTENLRKRRLRPHCEPCAGAKGRATIEIAHPPGEEVQWDFNDLTAPWGKTYLLTGTLPYSGRVRGLFCEGEDEGHVVEAIDGVLRRLGGTPRRWRFDRMSAVCNTTTGRLRASFAAVAKYYGAEVVICPARRANRKGAVEKKIHFTTQRWWRTAAVTTPEEAQLSFDDFCSTTADELPRRGTTTRAAAEQEPLHPLPAIPYPATVTVARRVSGSALVAFRGNWYSVAPGLVGRDVTVRLRVGVADIDVIAGTGQIVAHHRRAPDGAHAVVRSDDHRAALESVVLGAFTTARPCQRKANRPPSAAALALAAQLSGAAEVTVDLEGYAALARSGR